MIAPPSPIPAAATKIHGITDDMIAGHFFSNDDVAHWIASMTALCPGSAVDDPICVAANAAFDRPMLEAQFDIFAMLPWACSQTQIPWTTFGYEGSKLSYLAGEAGFFYERHKALDDCWAVAELLTRSCGMTPALQILLGAARTPSLRIVAAGAPYDLRQLLKDRGYRWNSDGRAERKAWSIEILEDDRDAELAFLRERVMPRGIEPLVKTIDAFDRFSRRTSPFS